jgi:glycosyltransferase involved in cell wall biosynthesis
MTTGAPARVTMLVRNPFTNDTRVEREARTLRDAGYQVTVLADAGDGLPLGEEREGVSVRRIPRRGPNLPGLRFLAHAWRLRRAVERTRPDVVHAHDADALQSAGPAAARLGVPLVYDSHELWLGRTARGRSRLYDLLNRAWYGLVERRYARRAALVLVANPGVGPELERRYGIRGVRHVANYPVEAEPVPARDLRSLPTAAAIPAQAPIVLYLGAVMAHRGVEEVVAALADVAGAHLVCLGAAGPHADFVRTEVARQGLDQRVHLVPPVPSEQVVPYAGSASVGVSLVQPASLSYRLALPNKLFQYMAAGLPVLASDFPDVRAVVEGSGAGVVVDPTDVAAVAQALRELLADPARARAMGDAGRRAVRERFNWGEAAGELLRGYRSLPVAP